MFRFTSPHRERGRRARLRCRALGAVVLAGLGVGGLGLGWGGSLESRLAEIRALQDAGEFSSSIEPLREILGRQPDHAEANFLLGVALVQTRQPSVAIWPLQKASNAKEFAVPAGILLASTLMNTGSHDEAIRAATRVLEVDPDRVAALQIRARTRIVAGQAEEALRDAQRVLELTPDTYQALVTAAVALTNLGRTDEAEATYLELLEAVEATGEPSLAARSCVALASFYSEIQSSEKLEATMERCTRQFPTDPEVVQAASRYYDASGRPGLVDDMLRRAMEEDADAYGPRAMLAQRVYQRGRTAEAEALLVEGAELFGTPAAWAGLASFYQRSGRTEEALEANEKAIAARPDSSEELSFRQADLLVDLQRLDEAEALAERFEQQAYRELIRGRVALARGENQMALQTFEAGLLRWPDNAPARFLTGLAAERLGDLSKALAHYREAVRVDDTATDAALAAARLELANGRFADASGYATIHLQKRAHDPGAFAIAIRALAAQGRYDEARSRASEFEEITGERLRARVELAAVERRAEGSSAALRVIEESGFDLTHPDHVLALRSVAEDLLLLGRAQAALERVDAAAADHPDVAAFHELRGRILVALERTADARAALERALALEPENPSLHGALGRLALAEGRADEAVEQLDRAVLGQPEDVENAYLAAQIRLSRGDEADAERRLREIVKRHPGHAFASNDLAWMLAERSEERAFALQLAQRAARIDPQPDILDTLAWVELQSGDAESAVETFERALAQQPNAPSVRYRYALALEAQGRSADALAALRRALESGAFPELEAARAHVARLEARAEGVR
jgi:tetratricopeptide (TPR) repeat protein